MAGFNSDRYSKGEFLKHKPTWDIEDTPWKAAKITGILRRYMPGIDAGFSVCDIGCGSGGVLRELRKTYPRAVLTGYDIAADAEKFWKTPENGNIEFVHADFLKSNRKKYDLILITDVIEHVENPFEFLSGVSVRADNFIFYIPLDLSALSVAREKPILRAREETGHIHYFTKSIALKLLKESGYDILGWEYSGASFSGPQMTWKSLLAAIPRKLLRIFGRDMAVRLLGGESLFVFARVLRR